MQGAGIVWDKATLDRFMADPDQVVPGHTMKPYGAIASAEERARIVAYLEASASADK
jgi:cytochrome c